MFRNYIIRGADQLKITTRIGPHRFAAGRAAPHDATRLVGDQHRAGTGEARE